jgi:uncharacterized protein (DUF362 family)
MGDIVSLVLSGRSKGELGEAVSRALVMTEFEHDRPVDSVAIKPNLCYYWDASTGYTTDSALVSAIIDWVRGTYGNEVSIRIVEADASAMRTKYAFSILGYRRLADKKNVGLVNLSEDELVEKTVRVNGREIAYKVSELLLNADLFINVPKLKVMRATKITCALKNVFGSIGYPKKMVYHSFLNEAIVGINEILHPHLTIVDGLVALGKSPVKLDLVMASKDPFSIDWIASQILGYSPRGVGFLKTAIREKVWSPEGIVVKGETSVEVLRKNFPREVVSQAMLWKLQLSLLKAYLRLVGDAAPHFVKGL